MNFLGFLKLSVPQFPTFYRIMRISLVIQTVKNLSVVQGTPVRILGQGRSPEEGNSNTVQYSCLENPSDRGTWQATVHGVMTE